MSMNPVEEQRSIIDQLHRIVSGSCPADAASASCRFEYLKCEDGSCSVTQVFEYVQHGKSVSAVLDRALRAPVMTLVKDLHAAIEAHTGGDWQAFVLAVNQDHSVTVRFEYPN
jgi:ABC-type cobalamin transport system ATPase subunit